MQQRIVPFLAQWPLPAPCLPGVMRTDLVVSCPCQGDASGSAGVLGSIHTPSSVTVWTPLFLEPSDGVFGRFDLAALLGLPHFQFLLVCLYCIIP